MTREIIAVLLGISGLIIVMICLYRIGSWEYVGILLGCILLLLSGVLGSRPDRPDDPV